MGLLDSLDMLWEEVVHGGAAVNSLGSQGRQGLERGSGGEPCTAAPPARCSPGRKSPGSPQSSGESRIGDRLCPSRLLFGSSWNEMEEWISCEQGIDECKKLCFLYQIMVQYRRIKNNFMS